VRDQEEVKLTIFDLCLLDKAVVDVSSLRRVLDELISLLGLSLLEESLTDAFVDNDKGNFWRNKWLNVDFFLLFFGFLLCFLLLEESIFFSDNFVKLVELLIDDHLSHGVSDTITIDENVFGHSSIEVFVALECSLEIV
jgi:hypothetical protein